LVLSTSIPQEAEMRKQDRIRQQESQDNSTSPHPDQKTPRPGEQEKGSASIDHNRPPHKPGDAMPLPD
jgi:hypothetical protein